MSPRSSSSEGRLLSSLSKETGGARSPLMWYCIFSRLDSSHRTVSYRGHSCRFLKYTDDCNFSLPFYLFPNTPMAAWLLATQLLVYHGSDPWFNKHDFLFSLSPSVFLGRVPAWLPWGFFFQTLIKLTSRFHLSSFLSSFSSKTKTPKRGKSFLWKDNSDN